MKRIQELHQKAMAWAEQAMLARIKGQDAKIQPLLEKALQAEREAAALCDPSLEPTRSVLYRSAASIALRCKKMRDAEQLIAAGLAGNPHEEIANELRDLLEQVWFERHLEVKGLTLDARELQLSISGRSVGLGMIESPEFFGRAQALERMILRTAQRRLNMPYREVARQTRDFREKFEVCYSVPRAASFAISMRVGRPSAQGLLFPDHEAERVTVDVIDEVVDSLAQMTEGRAAEVLDAIPDAAYRRNFQALARKVAPDGNNVTFVGLTVVRNDRQRKIKITQPIAGPTGQGDGEANGRQIAVTGYLRYASALQANRNQIRVVDDNGSETRFVVPEGMMNDIVRPLWDNLVVAEGSKKGNGFYLENIRESKD